eukprot:gene29057-38109_t
MASTENSWHNSYPTAYSNHNRVLGMILAFNYDHIDPLNLIMGQYQSMCEGGWYPTVAVFTTANWSDTMKRYFRQRTFCYRINASIPIIVDVHPPSIGFGLGAEHRRFMGSQLDSHDVFIYHEDDILVKHSHLVAYLAETKKLRIGLGDSAIKDYSIGFQRYRRLVRSPNHHAINSGEQDIFEQDLMEETPNFRPTCIANSPYLVVEGNIHQAMWILTREQVETLQGKCSFLNQSSPSREYMSSFSLFYTKKYHCALIKVIPGDRLTTFVVHHYYQQRHVSWYPVFHSDENIRAGYHYYAQPKVKVDLPPCWSNIYASAFAEQYPPVNPTS